RPLRKRSKTVMVVPTDSTRDTRGKSAKSGNLYATYATCELANFGCNLLTPLVDLEGFEPSTSVTARHALTMAGVDSEGLWVAADGPCYHTFPRRCGPVVAQKFAIRSPVFVGRRLASRAMTIDEAKT